MSRIAQSGGNVHVPDAGGPRCELDRVISFWDFVAIGFGVMIGVGWVVYAGHWLQDGGVLGAVLGFVIGGACFIPVGKCYAELTAALPLSGGEMAFSFKAFGPLMAFVTAWGLSLGYIAVVPFETIAFGAMVEGLFPGLVTNPLYMVGGYPVSWSGITSGFLAGACVVWLNWRGIRSIVRFQTRVILLLLGCTVAFCTVAFAKGDIGNLQPIFAGNGPLWAIAPASIASVIVVVPFFLAGFDCIPQAAEEAGMRMSPQQIGTAIVTCIVIGVIFYVVVILALAYSAPAGVVNAILADDSNLPIAEVFRHTFGYEWAAKLVLIAALLGIVSTLNGIFMAATRLLFAQGRGGLLPRWFAELHPVYRTPANAVLFVGALAFLGPFVGKAGLNLIVSSSSLAFVVAVLITGVAALSLRRSAPDLPRPYRTSVPTIWIGIVVSTVLVGLMVVPGSPGRMGTAEFTVIGLWMTLGLVFYLLRQSRGRMVDSEQARMILGEYR